MTHRRSTIRRRAATLPATLALAATVACGAGAAPAVQADGFPMTVQNCGRQVVLDAPPQRILALGGEAGSMLVAAGGADRISTFGAIEGEPLGAAGPALLARPQLAVPGSGEVSREVVLGEQPDLVVAFSLNDTTPEDLAAAGVPTLLLGARCPGDGPTGFDALYAEIALYGRVLGTEETAAAAVEGLRSRVEAARVEAARVAAARAAGAPASSAAALFVTDAQSALGAYGGRSMVHQQLEVVGLTDVFGGEAARYFEPSVEALIAAGPDVVLALHQAANGTADDARAALTARPELAGLPAVADGRVLVLDYFYSGDGVLAVEGVEQLAEQLAAQLAGPS